ncbi:hypothetical protein [Ruegeria atlantica]|uniref:hypothetical protein n=1 Tax=Ruegeria atlantica TaxID=81569 RepID=UPI00147B249E|nr:hypothetical protein [Ruegeria atlantica]
MILATVLLTFSCLALALEDMAHLEIGFGSLAMVALSGACLNLLLLVPVLDMVIGMAFFGGAALAIRMVLGRASLGQGDIWLLATLGLIAGMSGALIAGVITGVTGIFTDLGYRVARRRLFPWRRFCLSPAALPVVLTIFGLTSLRLADIGSGLGMGSVFRLTPTDVALRGIFTAHGTPLLLCAAIAAIIWSRLDQAGVRPPAPENGCGGSHQGPGAGRRGTGAAPSNSLKPAPARTLHLFWVVQQALWLGWTALWLGLGVLMVLSGFEPGAFAAFAATTGLSIIALRTLARHHPIPGTALDFYPRPGWAWFLAPKKGLAVVHINMTRLKTSGKILTGASPAQVAQALQERGIRVVLFSGPLGALYRPHIRAHARQIAAFRVWPTNCAVALANYLVQRHRLGLKLPFRRMSRWYRSFGTAELWYLDTGYADQGTGFPACCLSRDISGRDGEAQTKTEKRAPCHNSNREEAKWI